MKGRRSGPRPDRALMAGRFFPVPLKSRASHCLADHTPSPNEVPNMTNFDDSDMKIVTGDFDPEPEPAGESAEATARLLEREKKNGNLGKARRLGARMAEEVASIEGYTTAANGAAENPSLLTQRRILLAFAVEVGLDAFLPNNLVAQTAQNVFYDTLHITAPEFYDDLQESGAFSFYYLCVRDGRQVEKKVGETFASLCGMKGSESYARMGQELYIRFIGQVKRLTCGEQFAFVNEDPD